MRASRVSAAMVFVGGLAVSLSAWAPPGGNGGGGGNKGGVQGGGESALRLCAVFNDPDFSENYIDEDGGGQYCDGTDGGISIDTGFGVTIGTKGTSERRVSVYFLGSSCGVRREDGSFDGFRISASGMDEGYNAGFFNAQSSEFVAPAGCSPGDPFAGSFDPDLMACLESTETQLPVGEMRQSDGTRYMSMRVNLNDPNVKKDGNRMALTFAEDLGRNVCDIGDAALPVAIACTAEDGGSCSEWHLKAFRACAFDYDTSHGGNYVFGGNACPVSTDITFTVKP